MLCVWGSVSYGNPAMGRLQSWGRTEKQRPGEQLRPRERHSQRQAPPRAPAIFHVTNRSEHPLHSLQWRSGSCRDSGSAEASSSLARPRPSRPPNFRKGRRPIPGYVPKTSPWKPRPPPRQAAPRASGERRDRRVTGADWSGGWAQLALTPGAGSRK